METEKDLIATEEVLEAPPQKIKRGKKTYTPEVLAKKKEIAKMALEKATAARIQKQKEARLAKEVIEQAKKAKLEAEAKEIAKELIPAPPPPPEAPAAPAEAPVEAPVEKVSTKKAPKQKTQVYVDSSDDDSDSDDDYVLVKKRMVKKYRQIKKTPSAASHEISEAALVAKWQQDRYRLLTEALTGQW